MILDSQSSGISHQKGNHLVVTIHTCQNDIHKFLKPKKNQNTYLNTKIIAILTIIGAFAGPLLVPLILTPVITFDVNYETIQNQTNVKIKINNIGLSPATDVRITINPGLEFLEPTKITHYTDDISIRDNGPQSHIGEMERLSNSQHVSIVTSHNTTSTDLVSYSVIVTHDAGSATYTKSSLNLFEGISFWLLISAIVSLIVALILLVILSRKNNFSSNNENTSENNSNSKDPPSTPPPASKSTSKSNNNGIIPDLQTRLSTLESQFTNLTDKLGISPELIENKKLTLSDETINEINSILNETKVIKNKLESKNAKISQNNNLQLLIATYNYHINNLDKALQHIDNILLSEPDNWIALLDKGVILSDMGKNNESRDYYEKALKINPNNTIILNNLAVQLTDNFGEYEKAITYLDTVLKIDSSAPFAHYHKGNALFYLGNYKESEKYADIALNHTPFDTGVLCLKAICVATLQGPQESLEYFDKALEIDPNYFFAITNKATALEKLNRFEEALEFIDKALKIEPNNPVTIKNRDVILKKLQSKFDKK